MSRRCWCGTVSKALAKKKAKQVNIALLAMIKVVNKIFEGDAQLGFT